MGADNCLSEKEKNALSEKDRYSYQRGMVLPYLLLGILFIQWE